MKLTVDEILARVNDSELERANYRAAAQVWESMWTLQLYSKPARTVLEQEGREQVVLPTPYNIVHLARRLINSDPRIEVPAEDAEEDDDEAAERRQRWLSAFWQRTNREQRRDIIADMAWQVLVRGRCVVEIKWVEEQLPKRLQGKRLPVLVRTLDPLNVGVKNGPLYTEYAFHKYRQERMLAAQRYPNLKKSSTWRENDDRFAGLAGKANEVEVIDFWYSDGEGGVWNAVVVDGIFAKPSKKTDYPDIPIIEGYGDSSPLEDEEHKSLSILAPIRDLWPYQCRLASQVGTGLLYYFWPAILVSNEAGQEVPDLDIRPGKTTPVPMGTKVEMIRGDVNVPLAQTMLTQVDAHIQQSTFPGVMYGQAPGQMSAGYGVSILADQARGRIAQFRENLESTLEHANELILGLIETNASEKGVKVWGRGAADGSLYHEALTPKDIQGQWHNLVNLTPQITTDDAQKQTLGLRMVEKGIISKRTFRDRIMSMLFPADEQERIEMEKALESPQMQPKVLLRAIQSYFPDSWEEKIKGTPFEQVAMMDEDTPPGMPPGMAGPPGMQPPGMPPQGPPGPPPPGMAGPPPGAMPPQAGPPPGPPPGAMLPPDLPPPDVLIQMLQTGAMPPGVTPDMILQLLAAQGAPPELLQQLAQGVRQQGAIQPQGLAGPGVPPQMQGQLTPEMLNMGVGQGAEAAPGIYQQMIGQPLGEDEELDRMAMLAQLRQR